MNTHNKNSNNHKNHNHIPNIFGFDSIELNLVLIVVDTIPVNLVKRVDAVKLKAGVPKG